MIGVVGPYGFAAGGCDAACGAYGEATAWGGGGIEPRVCICGCAAWAAGFGVYLFVGGGMLGGALYGDGPRGIDAGGAMVDPWANGGDCGREAYGLAGGGAEGPGMLDKDWPPESGDIMRGGGTVPTFGGGGTDGARGAPTGGGP